MHLSTRICVYTSEWRRRHARHIPVIGPYRPVTADFDVPFGKRFPAAYTRPNTTADECIPAATITTRAAYTYMYTSYNLNTRGHITLRTHRIL